MKTYKMFPLLAASLLAPSALIAQNTATTTPVGYITMPVSGGGTPSSPKLSFIGPSLVSPSLVSGVAANTSQGTTVNFDSAVLTAGTYGLNSLSEPAYYVEIISGANAGTWSDIISNTATSLTLGDEIGTLAQDQSIVIRKHHTLGSLFGNTAATVAVRPAASIVNADELVLLNSTTQVPTVYYFSTDDGDEDGFPDGWITSAGQPSSDKVVSPVDGIAFRRKAAEPISIVQSGEVKTTPTSIRIEQGFNILPINRAVGQHFRLSPLTETSQNGGRTGSNLVGSGMRGGASIASADEITVLSNGVPVVYYYSTDDGDEDGFADGWVRSDGTPAGDIIIPEGSGIRIRRKSATPFLWNIASEPLNTSIITGASN